MEPPATEPRDARYEHAIEDRLEHEEMVEIVESISPEGRPAHPRMGPWQVGAIVAILVAVILGISIWLAVAGLGALAVGVAGIGVVLFLVNPSVWAGVLRARETSRATRVLRAERSRGSESVHALARRTATPAAHRADDVARR